MQREDGTRWMVLGASPSAPEFHTVPNVDVVVSAGDGILLQRPDYYILTEEVSLRRYHDERHKARALGTKVIIRDGLRSVFRDKMGSDFDFPCDGYISDFTNGSYKHSHKWYVPGKYAHSCAGCLALQWAVNHGAIEVHMVGLEGYTGGVDYFNGNQGNDLSARVTQSNYGPLVQRIVETHPDVQFTAYGDLKYSLTGDNVSFVKGDPDPAPALSRGLSLKE